MNLFRTLHQSLLVLFAVVVIAIVALAHFSLSNIVAEQSRAQQQSLSPAIELITEQILQPLHIAQTLALTQDVREVMLADPFSADDTRQLLADYKDRFQLKFFIASETARHQYLSDGTGFPLVEGEVNWYFKYKDTPELAIADIGKWEDTHFYIDLKVYDENDQFKGFFGVGKSLQEFLQVFEQYKQIYGYDFFIVDPYQNITLTSDPLLVAQQGEFVNLASLPWYQSLERNSDDTVPLNNQLVLLDDGEHLIAEFALPSFNWTVYLMTPLDKRQSDISRTFIISIVTLLVIIFALFLIIYNLLYYFKRDMANKREIDPLTDLPKRNKVEFLFSDMLSGALPVGLLLCDVDKLKQINEVHGREIGDAILKQLSALLVDTLRAEDKVARWDGEAFVILLPETDADQAVEVANKIKRTLKDPLQDDNGPLPAVTVSFGVTCVERAVSLTQATAYADEALYQAQRLGPGQIKLERIGS